jgi:steroid 5-alpha reductase family enzyme
MISIQRHNGLQVDTISSLNKIQN